MTTTLNEYVYVKTIDYTDDVKDECAKVKNGWTGLLIIKDALPEVEEITGLTALSQDLYGSKVIPIGGDDNKDSGHIWHETEMLWHNDRAYSKDVHPVVGLYCVSAPKGSASTRFCDMQTAYQDATQSLKDKSRITCVNDVDKYFQQIQYPHTFKEERNERIYRKRSKAKHDLTMTDNSGSWFFFSPAYTHVDHQDELVKHCLQDKYIYEHVWSNNDLLIYNNLKLIHARGKTPSKVKRRHLRYALR